MYRGTTGVSSGGASGNPFRAETLSGFDHHAERQLRFNRWSVGIEMKAYHCYVCNDMHDIGL